MAYFIALMTLYTPFNRQLTQLMGLLLCINEVQQCINDVLNPINEAVMPH